MRDRRPVRPAAPRKASYPRLHAAWRILAAPILLSPSLGYADATLPAPAPNAGKPAPAPSPPEKTPCPPGIKGKMKVPSPPTPPQAAPKPKKPPPDDPRIEGLLGQIRRPDAPVEWKLALYHPHGPEEPCFTSGGGDDDDA